MVLIVDGILRTFCRHRVGVLLLGITFWVVRREINYPASGYEACVRVNNAIVMIVYRMKVAHQYASSFILALYFIRVWYESIFTKHAISS